MSLPIEVEVESGSSDATNTSNGSSASFNRFVEIFDSIAAPGTRWEKCELISRYFSTLSPLDLAVAARLFSGKYEFPLVDQDKTSIHDSILYGIAACTGVPISFVKERQTALKSSGDAAFELFTGGQTINVQANLSLQDVSYCLCHANTARGSRRRTDLIVSVLRRCSPSSARFLTNLLVSEVAPSIYENLVKEAVSHWLNISISRVQSIDMLTGDIGETVVRCNKGDAESSRVEIFCPTDFVLAMDVITIQDLARLMPSTFVVEDRYEGIRVQVHIGLDIPNVPVPYGIVMNGIRVALFSKDHQEVTSYFPDLIPALAALLTESAGVVNSVGSIIDGEIIALPRGQASLPGVLSERLSSNKQPAADQPSVGFVAFDQLFGEGRSLIHESWADRRSMMCGIPFDHQITFLAAHKILKNPHDVEAEFAGALIRGNVGLVAKNPQSRYNSGRPVSDWLNISQLLPFQRR